MEFELHKFMTQKDKITTLWTQGVFFLLFSKPDNGSDCRTEFCIPTKCWKQGMIQISEKKQNAEKNKGGSYEKRKEAETEDVSA